MPNDLFPQTTPELAAHRKQLAPDIHDAFTHFSERVFAAGALPIKIKQLIAVAHVTQCPYSSAVTPRRRYGTGRRGKRLWKPSGSRSKCARAEPTRTRRSRSIRLIKSQAGLREPQSYR
jgi:hypothetical protein